MELDQILKPLSTKLHPLLSDLQVPNPKNPDAIIWTGHSSGKYKVATAHKKFTASSRTSSIPYFLGFVTH